MNILEGRSALLSPPASDLPTSPAPDAAMQKAILTRATDYANKVYAQNPRFMVKKVTARYQGRRTGHPHQLRDDFERRSGRPRLGAAQHVHAVLWQPSG